MATTISAPFGTLPHYLQQRVLAGVPFHDHQVTAAACKAFRAIIRGPGFLALRQRHGFAERVVVVVGNTHLAQGVRLVAVRPGQMTKEESALSGLRPEINAPGCSFEEKRLAKLLEVEVAAQGRLSEARTFEGVRISNRGTTTDGGARMFVSTLRYDSTPEQILYASCLRAQRADHRIPTKRKRICASRRRLMGHLRRRRGCWASCIWITGPPALRLRVRPPRLGDEF